MINSIVTLIYMSTMLSDIVEYSLSKKPGGRLNKKDGLTRCGDSHVKDKTS